MTPFVGQRITRSYTLSPDEPEELAVIGRVGTIEIVGEDRDDIDVDVVKQSSSVRSDLDELSVETEHANGTLEIRTEWAGESGWMESEPSVDLTITVPETFPVSRVGSVVGSAEIRNVRGELAIESTTGSITARDVDGSIDARSTTGRIELRDVTGTVTARTTVGRVEIRDVGAVGDIDTNTGRIEVDVPAIDGDTRISSTTGRVEAAIAADLDAELRASTGTGRVEYDELELTDEDSARLQVNGRLGEGGPSLLIETNTGRVKLTQLD